MFKAQAIEPYEGVFRVGAATKVGTFYKAASEMCDLMNRHDTSYCVPVVTNGSLHNLNLLLAGKLDMAIVKSDVVLALDRSGMSGKSRDRVGDPVEAGSGDPDADHRADVPGGPGGE